MRDRKTNFPDDQTAHNAAARDVTEPARKGRPKGSYSPLTQWLRPLVVRFQQQGCSCRNVFLGLMAQEACGDLDSFVVSSATASAYRHELSGDIVGARVTWAAFKHLWHRVSQQQNNQQEVANGH